MRCIIFAAKEVEDEWAEETIPVAYAATGMHVARQTLPGLEPQTVIESVESITGATRVVPDSVQMWL